MNATIKDYLTIFFRHFRYLVYFTLVTFIFFVVFCMAAKKIYRSDAKLLIRMGQEQTSSLQFASSRNNVYITRRNQELKNEVQILTSDTVAENVVRTLTRGTIDDVRLLESLKAYIKGHLDVELLYNSDTLAVSFRYPDPVVARKLLGIILDEYIAHHITVFDVSREFAFLGTNLAQVKANYEDLLTQFSAFMQKNNIYNDSSQMLQLIEKRDRVQSDVVELRAEHGYHKGELARLKKIHSAMTPTHIYNTVEVRNGQYDNLSRRLTEARLEEKSLALRYKKGTRFIADIEENIRLLEDLLASEPQRIVGSREERQSDVFNRLAERIVTLESRIEGERSQLRILEKALDEVHQEIERHTTMVRTYRILEKELEFAERTYDKYFDGYLENKVTKMLQAQNITNISVIEPPSLQEMVVWPKKKIVMLSSVGLFMFGNAFLLILLNLTDNTISRKDQIKRRLALPVLGVIPFFRSGEKTDGLTLHTSEDLTKEFRKMFVALSNRNQGNTFMVARTDNDINAGRAILFRLASFMAMYQHRKVAFVDLSTETIDPDEPALSLAVGPYSDFEQAELDGVTVLRPIPTRESIGVKENFESIHQIKNVFDYVFINIPAMNNSPELFFLSQYVDQTIFVIEAEKTKVPSVRYNIDLLKRFGFDNISILLNQRRFYIPAWLYSLI